MCAARTSLIFTVEPDRFFANPLTLDNFFQFRGHADDDVSNAAIKEHRELRKRLAAADIACAALRGPEGKPDAVFPNNSFSFHEKNGKVIAILYPMSPGRRNELPEKFLSFLKVVTDKNVYDLRHHEAQQRYLEGTGTLNFNHDETAVYMGRSERADEDLMHEVADILSISRHNRFVFDIKDEEGRPVYHTNVVNWVGKDIFAICWNSLPDGAEKSYLRDHVNANYKTVVDLSFAEVNAYAGNALEAVNAQGLSFLTISLSGYEGLTAANRAIIDAHYPGRVLAVPAGTIQKFGGGSVRCMEAQGCLPAPTTADIFARFIKEFGTLPE